MKSKVTNRDLLGLPLHDAALLSLEMHRAAEDVLDVHLVLMVNDEEPMAPFEVFGIQGRSIRLEFGDCMRVMSNIIGWTCGREKLDDWEVLATSELLDELRASGVTAGADASHYRITFSSGSTLDVIAMGVSLDEVAPQSGDAASRPQPVD